jgi:hypothetical protein
MNYPAIAAATTLAFIEGSLYCSPLMFGPSWMRLRNGSGCGCEGLAVGSGGVDRGLLRADICGGAVERWLQKRTWVPTFAGMTK